MALQVDSLAKAESRQAGMGNLASTQARGFHTEIGTGLHLQVGGGGCNRVGGAISGAGRPEKPYWRKRYWQGM